MCRTLSISILLDDDHMIDALGKGFVQVINAMGAQLTGTHCLKRPIWSHKLRSRLDKLTCFFCLFVFYLAHIFCWDDRVTHWCSDPVSCPHAIPLCFSPQNYLTVSSNVAFREKLAGEFVPAQTERIPNNSPKLSFQLTRAMFPFIV